MFGADGFGAAGESEVHSFATACRRSSSSALRSGDLYMEGA